MSQIVVVESLTDICSALVAGEFEATDEEASRRKDRGNKMSLTTENRVAVPPRFERTVEPRSAEREGAKGSDARQQDGGTPKKGREKSLRKRWG